MHTYRRIEVTADCDLVQLIVGQYTFRFVYRAAFDIAQHLRLNSRLAMQHQNVPREDWPAHTVDDDILEAELKQLNTSRAVRSSNMRVNCKNYRVGRRDALVLLAIDDVNLEFDADTAGKISRWLRQRAKEAKAWAGDTSTQIRAVGELTDAAKQ